MPAVASLALQLSQSSTVSVTGEKLLPFSQSACCDRVTMQSPCASTLPTDPAMTAFWPALPIAPDASAYVCPA